MKGCKIFPDFTDYPRKSKSTVVMHQKLVLLCLCPRRQHLWEQHGQSVAVNLQFTVPGTAKGQFKGASRLKVFFGWEAMMVWICKGTCSLLPQRSFQLGVASCALLCSAPLQQISTGCCWSTGICGPHAHHDFGDGLNTTLLFGFGTKSF